MAKHGPSDVDVCCVLVIELYGVIYFGWQYAQYADMNKRRNMIMYFNIVKCYNNQVFEYASIHMESDSKLELIRFALSEPIAVSVLRSFPR